MKQRPLFALLILGISLLGCAASNPPGLLLRPVRTPPSHPEALSHYIDAKLAEIKGQRAVAVRALHAAIAIDTTSATLYSALVRNLNGLQRYTEAIVPARRSVRLEPRNLEHRWLLYHALINGPRDTSSAVAQLETIAQTDPDPLRAYDQLQQIYTAQHRRDDVLRTLHRISTLPSLSIQGKLRVADHYLHHQTPERAEALYRQLLAENPRQQEIWLRLGSRTLTGGDTLKAAETFREGLSHFHNRIDRSTGRIWSQLLLIYDSDTHLEGLLSKTFLDTAFVKPLADVFMSMARRPATQKEPEKVARLNHRAERLLDRLIQAEPDRHEHLGKKAGILLRTNRPKAARATFERAFQQDPKAEYMLGVGHTYLAEEQVDKALEIFQTLYKQAPANSRLYPQVVFELGRIYTDTDRFADARSVYSQAAQADPTRPGYRYEVGRTYVFENAWKEAISIFEDLVDKTEDSPEFFRRVLFELGHCYERTGQFDDAVVVFQRLLALDPENHRSLNYLGYMLAEKGVRLSEAERLIERALKAEPKNSAYLDSMGWVYYRQGRYAEAVRFLESALAEEETKLQGLAEDVRRRFYGDLVVIYDHAGDAARALGDLNKARQHWERALEFDPGNETIRKKLQSFPGSAGGAPVGPE